MDLAKSLRQFSIFSSSSPAAPSESGSGQGDLSRRGQINAERAKGSSRVLQVLNDPYDSVENPKGYVNLGVADNTPMLRHVQEYINRNLHIDHRACSYGTGGTGSLRLKKATAALWNDKMHPHEPIKAEHIHFSAGCGALCEMLGWNLAEAGDAVLLSAPIYGAFTPDFSYKADLKVVHVSTGDDDAVGPNAPPHYEAEIKRLHRQGIKPKILLICTPHNPLGRCYDRDTMIAFCNLAAKYDMHLISDEVYALSIFSPPVPGAVPFTSVLSLSSDSHYLPVERIHVLYSFSKDIAGAGLRLGCLITRNQELRYAMGALSPMHWSSSLSDTAVAQMLEDRDWLEEYIERSQKMLFENYSFVARMLDEAGIAYYRGTSAAFFVWLDLSPFLPKDGDGKSGEEILDDRLFEAKVWTNNGKEFASDKPGRVRIVFTQEREVLKVGMQRLITVVKGYDIAERAKRTILER